MPSGSWPASSAPRRSPTAPKTGGAPARSPALLWRQGATAPTPARGCRRPGRARSRR
jgi:hypothetical protein